MEEQDKIQPNVEQKLPPSGDPQPREPGAQTNDNSNPQQGSGGMKAPPHSNPTAPQDFKIPSTKKDARKLFVGGLPSDVTDYEFRTFFEQFGPVLDSVVMFDRETHRSRGFGFVTFVDPEVSKKILSMGNSSDGVGRLMMRGKTCEVKAAQPKDGGFRGGGGGGGGGGGRGFRNDRRDHPKHFSGFGHHPGHHFPGFQPLEHMPFPLPPPGPMGAPMNHYPFYPPAPGYIPPHMFFPQGMPHHTQAQQPHFPPVPVGEYAGAFNPVPPAPGHIAIPPPPYMTAQEPIDISAHPHMGPPAPMAYGQSSSVMQPVAPGIPYKEEDGETKEAVPSPN